MSGNGNVTKYLNLFVILDEKGAVAESVKDLLYNWHIILRILTL